MNNAKTNAVAVIEILNGRQMMSATLAAPQSAVVMSLGSTANASVTAAASYGLTAAQKHRAEQITSTFENSTTELQYAFFSDINDGRGYTAGRAGFTTGTGDLHEVVKRYTQAQPTNGLAKYLPRLGQLSEQFAGNGYETPVADTSGLGGMKAAWVAACNDPKFIAAQDSLVDDWYYTPAMDKAKQLGLNTPLAKGQIWDALIQHGDGTDHDGLSAMITRTSAAVGGTPAGGVNEQTWIKKFMDVRIATLSHATNPDTAAAWAESTSRVTAYVSFADAGNYQMTGALSWTVYGDRFSLPAETTTTTPVATPTTPVTTTTPTTPTTTPVKTTGTISGRVFIDENEDGRRNNDDYGSEGRVVFLDTDNDHYRDENEVWTTTDAGGKYKFSDVAIGTKNVCLESVDWTYGTTQLSRQVKVTANAETKNVDFGEIWA